MSQRMRAYGETALDLALITTIHLGGGWLGMWHATEASWSACIALFALLQANKAIRGVSP